MAAFQAMSVGRLNMPYETGTKDRLASVPRHEPDARCYHELNAFGAQRNTSPLNTARKLGLFCSWHCRASGVLCRQPGLGLRH